MSQVVRGKAVAVEGVVLVAICLLLEGGEAEKSGRRIILVLSRRSYPAAVHRIVPHVLARTASLRQGPGIARCFPVGLANGRSSPRDSVGRFPGGAGMFGTTVSGAEAENPGQRDLAGIPGLVAGTGFEPAASGL